MQSELTAMQETVNRTQASEIHLATSTIAERLEKYNSEVTLKLATLAEALTAVEALAKSVSEEVQPDKLQGIAAKAVEPLQQDVAALKAAMATEMSATATEASATAAQAEAEQQPESESESLQTLAQSVLANQDATKALTEKVAELQAAALSEKSVGASSVEDERKAVEARLAALESSQQRHEGSSGEGPKMSDIEHAMSQLEAAQKALAEQTSDVVELERRLVERVDNLYARAATWKIHGFREKLSRVMMDALEGKQRSMWSPEFSVCAQPTMVIELQAATDVMPNKRSPLQPRIPVPGTCNLRLWAQPGLHLTFRFRLGSSSAAGGGGGGVVSRRFEHYFQEPPSEEAKDGEHKSSVLQDAAGRSCFTVQNFCLLDQAWDRSTNTMDVNFELLELRVISAQENCESGFVQSVEMQEEPSSEDQPQQEAEKAALDSTAVKSGKKQQANSTAGESLAAQLLRQHVHDPRSTIDPREKLADSLSFSHLASSEALIMERFKDDLQAVRNRTVRRVEWKVQGVARLMDLCKGGEAVDSPPFSAAGLENLRLHFYPRGHDSECAAYAQFCALYLSAPAGSTIRGSLFIGSAGRQFEQQYRTAGEFGGRSKFCSLESQHDCQDAVTLAVEIAEVELQMPDTSFNMCVRQVPAAKGGQAQQQSTSGLAANATMPVPASGTKGSLRMKRTDPTGAEDLLRTVSLPTLNTQKFYLPHLQQQQTKSAAVGLSSAA